MISTFCLGQLEIGRGEQEDHELWMSSILQGHQKLQRDKKNHWKVPSKNKHKYIQMIQSCLEDHPN